MKLLYDIECFWNYFEVGFKNFETKDTFTFEIAEDIDQSKELYEFLRDIDAKNTFFISFNGIDYDNIVTNYFYKNYKYFVEKEFTPLDICHALKEFSNYVINNKDSYDDEQIKKYKYHNKWIDIDLLRYWSKKTRQEGNLSLKSLGIQLEHGRVQELPYDFNKILTKEERDDIKDYNVNNDLVITDKLCQKMRPQIIQRQDANEKYGFNSFSWDGVKLGLNILLEEYCKKYNYDRKNVNSLRGKLEPMKLERIILDKIKFTETEEVIRPIVEKGKITYYCNSFYTLLKHLKTRITDNTKELSYSVILDAVKYDLKSGGLHTYHNPEIVSPDLDKFIYRDKDVNSMYPTLGATYRYVPRHLPGMDTLIEELKNKRLQFKKEGNKKDAELYKLALNGG